MGLVVTRKAMREHCGFTVWKPKQWATPFFAKMGGRYTVRKARLLLALPYGFGLFWTHGKEWTE